jgi:hypothetical protein
MGEALDQLAAATPHGKPGTPDDIAYLATDDAAYVHGDPAGRRRPHRRLSSTIASDAARIGPAPAYEPELAATVTAVNEQLPPAMASGGRSSSRHGCGQRVRG